MGEGGGTAHFRVQSIVRVNRQRLPSKAFWKRLGWFLFGARLFFYLDVGARQAPGKYRLAPSSISAGILLSRGWGPGANYSLLSCPIPRGCPIRPGLVGKRFTWRLLLSGNRILSMLASEGGLSYGSPAAASDRPSRLILIWLYLYVASHVSST